MWNLDTPGLAALHVSNIKCQKREEILKNNCIHKTHLKRDKLKQLILETN